MATAHINRIGTAVPAHDVHETFIGWASTRLPEGRERKLFGRMAARAGIARRWSVLPVESFETGGFYGSADWPTTGARMARYAAEAPPLALAAITALGPLGAITHLVVASCTGFTAPGVDQIIARAIGLSPDVQRTLIGFMGCYASVPALRAAKQIVAADETARVLVVSVELSTLHLQADRAVEPLLAMLLFGDGAGAAIVSAEPTGLALGDFFSTTLPDSEDLITWTIGDAGFVMHLSGDVPKRIAEALRGADFREKLAPDGRIWAVHPGGRSILDAVEDGVGLDPAALDVSRAVLADHGNMSSATLLFVLQRVIARGAKRGTALAFGPGLAAEGFHFHPAR